MKMKKFSSKVGAGAGLLVLAAAALSLVHPWGNVRASAPRGDAILAGSTAPEEVKALLARKCNDCHSNQTNWPLYSNVAPASLFIEHDVHEGRDHMNMSRWADYSIENRIDLLSKIASQVRDGKMPLKQYVMLHPEAKLSDEERKMIQTWAKTERKRLLSQEQEMK